MAYGAGRSRDASGRRHGTSRRRGSTAPNVNARRKARRGNVSYTLEDAAAGSAGEQMQPDTSLRSEYGTTEENNANIISNDARQKEHSYVIVPSDDVEGTLKTEYVRERLNDSDMGDAVLSTQVNSTVSDSNFHVLAQSTREPAARQADASVPLTRESQNNYLGAQNVYMFESMDNSQEKIAPNIAQISQPMRTASTVRSVHDTAQESDNIQNVPTASNRSSAMAERIPIPQPGPSAAVRQQSLAHIPSIETSDYPTDQQYGLQAQPDSRPQTGISAQKNQRRTRNRPGHNHNTTGRQNSESPMSYGYGQELNVASTFEQAPRRRRRVLRVLSTLLIIVGVGLLAVAGIMWGTTQWRYHQQDEVNDRLAEFADITDSESQAPRIDWAGLKAINDEVVGWIQVPNTVVNYPVYQASDNDRYLRHTATGEWTWGGQVFMDFENTPPGMIDAQTIIYGHHLQDGSMFQPLSLLDDQARFDATPTIWYVTEDTNWELEPLLLYYTQDTDSNARHFRFADDEEFREYLRGLLARSVTRRADAEQIIAGARHVLTMSTCNYYDGYGRSLLVAVPKDEAREALAVAAASE